jgi:hypothetical protein
MKNLFFQGGIQTFEKENGRVAATYHFTACFLRSPSSNNTRLEN